ncbi:DUF2934 domain-containing protein [Ensifer sp.]|jgi:hypothetical protein|uniref:DUF2934 domain-containing protein n=1 Tax=Ensifer sp. TaxID=1872086 RepID=UPI002E1072F1|nr:DUF2934 domain-containing protein [Ensifer sp.]
MEDREERIRRRAYAIWEKEGQPVGEEMRHWEQARREIEAEDPSENGAEEEGPGTIVAPSTAPRQSAPGETDEG